MIISLIGYMGSGKSHIAKVLSQKLSLKLIDLDSEISLKNKMSIPEIFLKKGEIYFRKQEKETLEEILTAEETGILSVGGGTPCFYNNMETINHHSKSIYLRTTIKTLAERLIPQKAERPLISRIQDEDIPEFIAKHLFERNSYYSKAQHTMDTDGKTPEKIANEILALINFPGNRPHH